MKTIIRKGYMGNFIGVCLCMFTAGFVVATLIFR